MVPEQFLAKISKQKPAPAYLFLGPEAYQRGVCKNALVAKILRDGTGMEGFTQFDLDEVSLAQVIDDARSLSLFASERVLWIGSAESALPKRLSSSTDEDNTGLGKASEALIDEYLNAPTPGTVLVFECGRYDFSGDDKAKLDRVAKFYSAIPDVVEFRSLTVEQVRALAHEILEKHKLNMETRDLGILLDAVGADAMRLANEVEKLSIFAGPGGKVTGEDVRALVVNASESTIFGLVNALGRRDRAAALASLDLLVRDGEYLPLALTFLGTEFRLALVVHDLHFKNFQQVLNHFSRQGVRMWRHRAEQLVHTASVFGADELRRGIKLIYEADKGLRDTRPDDRTVMEKLVVDLTG